MSSSKSELVALKQHLGKVKDTPELMTRRDEHKQYILNRLRSSLPNQRERAWSLFCTALIRVTNREMDAVEKIETKLKLAETLPGIMGERSDPGGLDRICRTEPTVPEALPRVHGLPQRIGLPRNHAR